MFCKLDVVNIEENGSAVEEELVFNNDRPAIEDMEIVEENGLAVEPVVERNETEDVNKTLVRKEKKKREYKEKGKLLSELINGVVSIVCLILF